MPTGELRSKIDNVWNTFWAGGIANPIEVIEQITYLLFMRGLDDPPRWKSARRAGWCYRWSGASSRKARTISATPARWPDAAHLRSNVEN
jgi:HsdM N-terminal domain